VFCVGGVGKLFLESLGTPAFVLAAVAIAVAAVGVTKGDTLTLDALVSVGAVAGLALTILLVFAVVRSIAKD
jgi:hypothetical protein